MRPKKVLLMAPVFHGYSESIAQALECRGHDITLWHYDQLTGAREKLRHKLRHELLDLRGSDHGFRAFQKEVTTEALARLRSTSWDVVLGIKADTLLPDFWIEAERRAGLRHLWLYDEVRRMRHAAGTFELVDRLTTYSRLDHESLQGAALNSVHVPNAFDARLPMGSPRPMDSFLFVGARYPNREALLMDLTQRGVPVTAVGRDWSHHPFDRLRTWQLHRPPIAALRDVSRAQAYGLMAGAVGNLNSHHDQDGFTMRTFEIPGVGGVQLIDRADVAEYFEPGAEVLVYNSVEELDDLCRRILKDRVWATTIGERARTRTLAEHTFDHRVAQVERQWG